MDRRSNAGGILSTGCQVRVSLVAVGKAKSLAPAIQDYQVRAGRHWALEVVEVRQARGNVAAQVLSREAAALKARLRPGFVRVAVARGGDHLSSVEFARWLRRLAEGPAPGVHFLIGGAFGLDAELRDACGFRLSLSSLTLPHDLARLLLLEQLYRAGTILGNQPYHKGPR